MTAAAALALAAAAGLPDGAEQRYRVEIAGQPIGWAEISVRCLEAECAGPCKHVQHACVIDRPDQVERVLADAVRRRSCVPTGRCVDRVAFP